MQAGNSDSIDMYFSSSSPDALAFTGREEAPPAPAPVSYGERARARRAQALLVTRQVKRRNPAIGAWLLKRIRREDSETNLPLALVLVFLLALVPALAIGSLLFTATLLAFGLI
ncbi:hypothetical protein [Tropicimonas sp. IMCC34011]|uniref:hypothetical protein n=1 Tax=Tropicimonas sp. IMCC34011 TaxID=2248759 RepID=UPI000E262C90|nr:hypothetical protein [Tropicimonas sp. IMCC34011]